VELTNRFQGGALRLARLILLLAMPSAAGMAQDQPVPQPLPLPLAPQPPPTPVPAAPTAPAPPATLEPIPPDEATPLLGRRVRGPAGETMGRVTDVLVDANGQPRAAVIDFGGVLGVGSRKIAVTWQLLQFRPGDREAPVLLNMTRAQIQAAPEFKPATEKPAEAVAPPPPAPPPGGDPPPLEDPPPAPPLEASPTPAPNPEK